ncbi:MAG: hypothetical protein CMJ64_18515, partial [Planctomycetaceae bacterium]|nr:hypothetical protein [Planctomycetaceae bacterium]
MERLLLTQRLQLHGVTRQFRPLLIHGRPEQPCGGVTFFLYFQLFDIAALRFVSLRTKGKAAMLA